jgi:hypothetical protein
VKANFVGAHVRLRSQSPMLRLPADFMRPKDTHCSASLSPAGGQRMAR